MTATLSFWAGLAVGILSTMAGSAGVVVWLIRKAPQWPDVGHIRIAEPVEPRWYGPDEITFTDDLGEVTDDQWDQLATRGPVTDYRPGVAHHELSAETGPDGITIYRSTT